MRLRYLLRHPQPGFAAIATASAALVIGAVAAVLRHTPDGHPKYIEGTLVGWTIIAFFSLAWVYAVVRHFGFVRYFRNPHYFDDCAVYEDVAKALSNQPWELDHFSDPILRLGNSRGDFDQDNRGKTPVTILTERPHGDDDHWALYIERRYNHTHADGEVETKMDTVECEFKDNLPEHAPVYDTLTLICRRLQRKERAEERAKEAKAEYAKERESVTTLRNFPALLQPRPDTADERPIISSTLPE